MEQLLRITDIGVRSRPEAVYHTPKSEDAHNELAAERETRRGSVTEADPAQEPGLSEK